jgi:transposase
MGKRRKFTNEFKLEAVKPAEKGDTRVAQVARDLDLQETTLRRWMQRYGQRADGGRMTPEEHEELIRRRRENKRLTMERDILKKAVGIFSATRPADKSKELP